MIDSSKYNYLLFFLIIISFGIICNITSLSPVQCVDNKNLDEDYDGDDIGDNDNATTIIINNNKQSMSSLSPTSNLIESETITTISSINDKDDDDDDEVNNAKNEYNNKGNKVDDDDDYYDENDNDCDGRLSTFVRSFDGSSLLPDDYEILADRMHSLNYSSNDRLNYNQIHHINDTLAILERLGKIVEKLRSNKDLSDTVLYIGSVLMDKAYEAKVPAECLADLATIGNALRNMEPWAFKCVCVCLQP